MFHPPTCELKIGLKSVEKTEHIRSISPKTLKIARKNGALPFTQENRRGKTWTEDEENLIRLYYQQGKDFITIASLIGRTEVAIKSRLAKLGLIDYTYGQENDVPAQAFQGANRQTDESDFVIKNLSDRAVILDQDGKPMFVTDGKLKYLRNSCIGRI